MTNTLSEQLRAEADQLDAWASKLHDPEIETPLKKLEKAAGTIGVSWSGSSISYHSRVYYKDFQPPPAGAHFSTEWGFTPAMIGGTRGDWQEYEYNDVVQLIYERAGKPDLSTIQTDSGKAREAFYNARPECLSILTIFLMGNSDPYLQRLRDEIESLGPLSEAQAAKGQLPSGQIAFRDPAAQWEVLVAPHQAVLAKSNLTAEQL